MDDTQKTKEERVGDAVQAVKRGVPVRTAARQFSVPHTTLVNRLAGRPAKRGPGTILTEEEERLLVDWLKDCARKGFPRRKDDLLRSVKEFMDKNENRKNPFVENIPGRHWMEAFLKRHPDITFRLPEGVSRAAGNVSEGNIRQWFKDVQDVVAEEGAVEAWNDPGRVFNCDETNFKLCPKKSAVLAEKGTKDVYEIAPCDPKYAVTAMFAFSAAGTGPSPMLVFPYQRIPASLVKSVPPAWGVGRSDSGWMTAETFYEYIGNIFATYLEANQVKRPVILFVDGHKTHLTRETSVLCKELGIVLIALYPNATHILQPCDVAGFRPIKALWQKALLEWRRSNPQDAVTKEHIGPILQAALEKKDLTDAMKNGFRATGLFPFDPNAVNYSKCKGKNTGSEAQPAAQSDQTDQESSATLTLPEFEEVLGKNLMDKLRTGQAESAESIALLRLYEKLGGKTVVLPPTDNMPIGSAPAGSPQRSAHTPIPVNLNLVRVEPNRSSDEDDPGEGPSQDQATRRPPAALRDVLMWPLSPKRKGKRKGEKMPYVITSKRWQDFHDAKDQQKAEEEAKKAARARERAEKKAEKEREKQDKALKKASKVATTRRTRSSKK